MVKISTYASKINVRTPSFITVIYRKIKYDNVNTEQLRRLHNTIGPAVLQVIIFPTE